MGDGSIHGYQICQGAPVISHLLFADDTIIFCKANMDEARTIRDLLHRYELTSGQQVNMAKTNVSVSKGTSTMRRDEVMITLDVREVLAHDKYLGLPTRMGRSKKKVLMPLKDCISKKINGWMGRNLSWAGREVLVNAVAQVIPT